MEKNQKDTRDYYTIDMVHVVRKVWYKAWLVVFMSILAAILGFGFSAHVIQPDYASSILLYVNNSSINVGNTSFNISASDITASQSLVKTYTEMLKNRTTLERIIDKAEVEYNYIELDKMIESGPSHETEVMRVTVTSKDPYEASLIANTIAIVLPERISEVIDGASMEVVDSAIPITQKVSPSITKYTAVFMVIGAVISILLIAISAMRDDTIYDEEYIMQNYEYPILATIPNLLGGGAKSYKYKKNRYYYTKN